MTSRYNAWLLVLVLGLVAPRAAAQDAGLTAPQRMSFADALRLAKAQGPQARIAEADLARAEAQIQQARAASYPTLALNASYTRLDQDRTSAGRVIQAANSVNGNAVLTVPLVVPSRWATWRRAEDQRDSMEAVVRATRRDVLLAAARGYLAILLQQKGASDARRARDVAKAHLAFAEARAKGGVGTKLDVVRAAQEVEATESAVAVADLALLRSQEALGVVLGLDHPVDAAAEPALEMGSAPAHPEQRPEVLAQMANLSAAQRAKDDNFREYLPQLSATAQPFFQNPATLILPETGWQAQLILSVPLYDGGLRYGQRVDRDAALAQARVRLEDARRRANADLRSAVSALGIAETVVQRARAAAALAHTAEQLAQLAYEAGAGTNLELIDADRRARDADARVALAEDELRRARLDWLNAANLLD